MDPKFESVQLLIQKFHFKATSQREVLTSPQGHVFQYTVSILYEMLQPLKYESVCRLWLRHQKK